MKYTAAGLSHIEEKIEGELSSIREEIISERKRWGLVSLILYGGFARGEGSVEVEDEIKPLNDYDFLAVSTQPFPKYRSFKRFIGALTSGRDYKVDAMIRPLWMIKKAKPSIFNYELKNGGKVIWGQEVLRLMPEIPADSIPLADGLKTFFNRLMSLMEAYGTEDRKFIIYQSNKAVLTCMEMLLLLAQRYHWSYRERLSIFKSAFEKFFPQLSRDYPEFLSLAERATNFKLSPDYRLYPEEDLWEKAAFIYFRFLNFYLKEFERQAGKGEKWLEIMRSNIFKSFLSWLVFRLRKIAKGNSSWYWHPKFQPYLLSYQAAYEWFRIWAGEREYFHLRKCLADLDSISYTDDFLDLKDKIIANWKESSFIL